MAMKPFFVVPLGLSEIVTGNEQVNRPALHLGEFNYRGMVWQSDGNANLWVRARVDEPRDVDFVAVLNANAQPGTTIRVRMGDTTGDADAGVGYDSGAVPFISPAITRADGLYHSHLEIPPSGLNTYVRIDIGNHTGDFEASMLVAGKRVHSSHYADLNWTREVRDLGSVTFSRNGVPAVQEGSRLRATSFRLGWLTEDEMEETFSPIDEAIGKTYPLYLCFDPDPNAYRQRRTFFGFCEEQAEYQRQGFNRYSREFRFLSLF